MRRPAQSGRRNSPTRCTRRPRDVSIRCCGGLRDTILERRRREARLEEHAHRLKHDFYPSTIGAIFGGSGFFPDAMNGLRALVMLPPLSPLRPGAYSVGLSVTFADVWCDGTSDDIAACMPGGTTFLYSRDFTVVDGC